MHLWAKVQFNALGGQTADFLQRATAQNFKLRKIRAVFGGVSAQCTAGRYFALHKLAKSCHVRLRIVSRRGVYFRLRRLFAQRGVWCGVALFVLFLACNQNLIWQIDYSALTTGQQARVEKILWEECSLAPGAYSTEELLAAGEAAILADSSEFSWVSLNFAGGRLTIEAAAAIDAPEIAAGTPTDILARVGGKIVSVNVRQGTAMVVVGQDVVQGDVLIGAARLEHDQETLVYEPTAGEVLAEFNVEYCESISMLQQTHTPIEPLRLETNHQIFAFGKIFSLPDFDFDNVFLQQSEDKEVGSTMQTVRERMVPLAWLGFSLPATVHEKSVVLYEACDVAYTQEECLALAQLACSRALYEEYPDAIILKTTERVSLQDMDLCCAISYRIISDIASHEQSS